MEDLWSQKLYPDIISELFEERDNENVMSSDRPGFMQGSTASCPSASVAQCGSALEMVVQNIPARVWVEHEAHGSVEASK